MLTGRRVVVTGASSGIGRALCVAYARAGARVIGVGRDLARLGAVAAEAPGMVPVPADLTSSTGRAGVAAALDGEAIDAAVHAAGLLGVPGVELEDYPEREWRDVLEANLTALHLLHQQLFPALQRGHHPVVIALASTVGRSPRAGWGAYAVSKAAVEAWVALLAAEWTTGRVYSVNPGGTRTPMRAAAMPGEDPATVPAPEAVTPLFLRLAHPSAPEPSGAVLEAKEWIGKDPWAGMDRHE